MPLWALVEGVCGILHAGPKLAAQIEVGGNYLLQRSQYALPPGKSRGSWICPMNKLGIKLATLEFLGVCVLLGFTQWGTLSLGDIHTFSVAQTTFVKIDG